MESLVVQLLIYGLTNGAVLALSAAGFTLTYAVARQINLAHGSTFALCTVIVTSLAAAFGITEATPIGLRLGVLVVLAACGAIAGAALSVGVERLAFRPFATLRDPLGPLVASLGLAFILLQAAVWWHSVRFVPVPNAHQGVDLPLLAMPDVIPKAELAWGGVSFTLKDALVLASAALVAALLGLVLEHTRVADCCAGQPRIPSRSVCLAATLDGRSSWRSRSAAPWRGWARPSSRPTSAVRARNTDCGADWPP